MVYENSKSCRYQIEVIIQLSKIQKTYREPVCFVKMFILVNLLLF